MSIRSLSWIGLFFQVPPSPPFFFVLDSSYTTIIIILHLYQHQSYILTSHSCRYSNTHPIHRHANHIIYSLSLPIMFFFCFVLKKDHRKRPIIPSTLIMNRLFVWTPPPILTADLGALAERGRGSHVGGVS